MSRVELLTPSLLRMDGRRPYEFRSLEIHFSPLDFSSFSSSTRTRTRLLSSVGRGGEGGGETSLEKPDGSVRFVQGLNDVRCDVFGPRDSQLNGGNVTSSSSSGIGSGVGGNVPGVGAEGASLQVQVVMGNVSAVGAERRQGGTRGDRRTTELSQLMQRTLAPIVSLHLYPRSSVVHISIYVSSSDGSLLSTMLNAASLALQMSGISTLDSCLSTCLAFHPRSTPSSSSSSSTGTMTTTTGTFLLDPTLSETSDLPNLTVAITPRDGKVLLSLLDSGRGKVESVKVEQGLKVAVQSLSGAFRKELETATRHWGKKLLDVGT